MSTFNSENLNYLQYFFPPAEYQRLLWDEAFYFPIESMSSWNFLTTLSND